MIKIIVLKNHPTSKMTKKYKQRTFKIWLEYQVIKLEILIYKVVNVPNSLTNNLEQISINKNLSLSLIIAKAMPRYLLKYIQNLLAVMIKL